MFEHLIRELGRMNGTHNVAVSIPSDAEGYFDRECPSLECLCQFKIHEDDWRDEVRHEKAFCAFCGHEASSEKWWTQEQLKYAEEVAVAQFEKRISDAMRVDARRWNSRQSSNGFLRITLSVKDGPRHYLLPPAALEPMRLRIECPECNCRYAAIGVAFFCPACGHNAADLMFKQTTNGIRSALSALVGVKAAIADRDAAESTARLMVEASLQSIVSAFQRYAEALYGRFEIAEKPRRNAFQSLSEGSELWKAATGRQYSEYIEPKELECLVRGFQQRHLLAHRDGIVDDSYLTKSGDSAYKIGQRIVIKETAVREYLGVAEKLARGMSADAVRPAQGVDESESSEPPSA